MRSDRGERVLARLIYLTRGFATVVDDDDFGWLSAFEWRAVRHRDAYYAERTVKEPRSDGTVRYSCRQMQREILDPERAVPRHILADHIDRDTLNNQRYNLRLADYSTSNLNRGLPNRANPRNTTGYRWVLRTTPPGAFRVMVRRMEGGRKVLYTAGRDFADVHEAAAAANEIAVRVFGPDAVLNVIRRDDGVC